MERGSRELIRDMNTSLILQTIIEEGALSRADLAKQLHFSKATVSAIVQSLIERKLVRETGNGSSEIGRKPILLDFYAESGSVLSIDLQTNLAVVLLTDLSGRQQAFFSCPHHPSREHLLSFLASLIRRMITSAPESPYGLIGITLAIHGVVHKGQLLFTPYYPYDNFDFSALEEMFHIPVYVENEANLAVMGEHAFCLPNNNIASLSIHSGVGLGLIINGTLFSGSQGFAGEFGHTTIEINGRPCPCGNRGCLEQYLSERVLLEEYARAKSVREMNLTTLCRDYYNEDSVARQVVLRFLKYLAVAIHNIQHMINPELIVINSRVTAMLPDTLPLLNDLLTDNDRSRCPVLYSELKSKAIPLGGIVNCIKQFLKIDLAKLKGNNDA